MYAEQAHSYVQRKKSQFNDYIKRKKKIIMLVCAFLTQTNISSTHIKTIWIESIKKAKKYKKNKEKVVMI